VLWPLADERPGSRGDGPQSFHFQRHDVRRSHGSAGLSRPQRTASPFIFHYHGSPCKGLGRRACLVPWLPDRTILSTSDPLNPQSPVMADVTHESVSRHSRPYVGRLLTDEWVSQTAGWQLPSEVCVASADAQNLKTPRWARVGRWQGASGRLRPGPRAVVGSGEGRTGAAAPRAGAVTSAQRNEGSYGDGRAERLVQASMTTRLAKAATPRMRSRERVAHGPPAAVARMKRQSAAESLQRGLAAHGSSRATTASNPP
jgi:hypothetical protein